MVLRHGGVLGLYVGDVGSGVYTTALVGKDHQRRCRFVVGRFGCCR